MATTGNQWAVVKTNKKNKAPSQLSHKQQQKILAENMPRIEKADPVEEDSTIYDAFLEKNHHAERTGKEQVKPGINDEAVTKKVVQQKKQLKSDKKKDKPPSLEEALAKIDCKELEAVLTKDQAAFPDSPSVWLKDMASILSLKLDCVPEKDPIFEGKPKDYPVCMVPGKVRKLMECSLKQCSTQTLELFLEHCIQSMINDMGKGVSTYGCRIFLQLLAFTRPEIIMNSLPKQLEIVKSNQNRPLRCLSIMWAIGQAGHKDLANGLRIWLEVMQPVLNVRSLSSYVVEYLDNLFRDHKNLKSAYGVIGYRNYFHILDVVFAANSNLHTNLQKKLQALYPRLKTIAIGGDPGSTLWSFFPSFLIRATPNSNRNLKEEMLNCLVECLVTDRISHNVWRQWRQMYVKHLGQSGVLLHHLADNWDKIGHRLEKKTLKETIRGFSITNEELAGQHGQGYNRSDGYHQCVTACKDLLLKMSTHRFPWRFLLLLVISIFAGVITYDIYVHGGFKKSRSAKLLQDAGLLVFLEQIWNRIRIYSGKIVVWLQDNVPYYFAKTCDFVGPYLQLFWEKLYLLGMWIVEVTQPTRAYLNRKVPELLEWVQSKVPWLWDNCSYYLGLAWQLTVQYSLWLWGHLVHYTHVTGTWLQENVFTGSLSPENIQKAVSSSVATAQGYSSSFIHWCGEMWSGSAATAK